VKPDYDPGAERDIKEYVNRYLSVAFENYGA
jgi:hypothetical protein